MKIPIDTQELAVNILRQVDGMRRDEKHCDFLIKVGSEEIPAHRNILSATSDYFDAMFRHPTEENKSGVVVMMGVDPECAVICVDHMYGKEVSILPQKYEPLIYVATLMQLHKVRDAIVSLVETNLDPKLFFSARRIASIYGYKNLEQKCKEFAEENFGLISKEEEFGELDQSYIKKMIKNVKISEEQKLCGLLKWIEYDSERRRNLVGEFLDCVDLLKIPVEYRRYVAENEPLVSENFTLFKTFSASMLDSAKIGSRSASSNIEVDSGIIIFDGISQHLHLFNARDNKWKRMQKMTVDMKRNHFSAIVCGGNLYVLMRSKSVYRLEYSDEEATWEQREDMIEDHGICPPAAVHSDCIYVIGGYKTSEFTCETATVEKYNTATNQWLKLLDKPHPSCCSSLQTFKGHIYSFGGWIQGEWTNKVEKFDPSAMTWSELAPMRVRKGYAGTAELNGKIFLLGSDGRGHSQTVEVYDVEANLWTTLKPMNVQRSWLRGFAINGSVYAVGGYNISPHSIEKFVVEENEWKMVEVPDGMKILESVAI